MVILLELKEKFKLFYNKYNTYIVPVAKFILALISFLMINMNIGYMTKIKNPLIAVLLSIICAFLPNGFMLFALSTFILAHIYAISAEYAIIVLCIILIMYLVYFRFSPKQGILLIITVMLCSIRVPYLLPVAVGLCCNIAAIVPVSFGVIIYYVIKTVSDFETAIANQSVSDSMQKISYMTESLLNNKEMITIVMAFVLTIAVVYFVRRLKVDYAWTYAIISGTAVQFVVLIVGAVMFSVNLPFVFIIVGTILGALLSYICQVVFFNVDYKRTEYVQYEDDEYYYYVKAVPKINIVNADVKVKQINARKTKEANDISDVNISSSRNAVSSEEDTEEITFVEK